MLAQLRTSLGSELESLSEELTARLAGHLTQTDPPVGPAADDERVQFIQQRMRQLGQLVAGLARMDQAMIWRDRAGFGSIVCVRDRATGAESTYTLMTGDLADLNSGHVSLTSPIGHALLGRRAGDAVSVTTLRGERWFDILSVVTLPRRLGMSDGPDASHDASPQPRMLQPLGTA